MNQEAPPSLFWYRVKFLALVAVFLAPFVGGWLAFYVFELRPAPGNYGSLVQPVRNIDWPLIASRDGRRFDQGFGRKWTLLMFIDGACGEQCFDNLFHMRQLRTLLGRDTLRLQNVLVSARPVDEKLEIFLSEYPNLVVIDNESAAPLFPLFDLTDEPAGAAPKMYLVDPDQNWMMHYPAAADHDRVLEDIKKLMKLSQIG